MDVLRELLMTGELGQPMVLAARGHQLGAGHPQTRAGE
jgi:hypothetical protein